MKNVTMISSPQLPLKGRYGCFRRFRTGADRLRRRCFQHRDCIFHRFFRRSRGRPDLQRWALSTMWTTLP